MSKVPDPPRSDPPPAAALAPEDWPLWDVFVQNKEGDSHEHAGWISYEHAAGIARELQEALEEVIRRR